MQSKMNTRTWVCLVLTVFYILGLILILVGNLGTGITLWAISTVAGMGVLYLIHKKDKQAEGEKAQSEQNQED